MPTETVNATLLVGDGQGGQRQLTTPDLHADQTGDSSEVTLAAFKTANHTDLAALATDLAAILAKLTADPSTGAKQDTLHADLAELVVLHADLAAVLAKESADPATQTTLSALVAANHTDLAAILAKDEAIRALLAGTLLVGSNSEAVTLADGTTRTIKRGFANIGAGTTDGAVVAAVIAKKIRVLSVYAVAGGTATTLTFNTKPAGAGTAISALLANGANGGEVLGNNPAGWFETASGEGLSATTGAGSATGIGVLYIEV